MAFFDDLASLCAKEMNAARKGGNSQRKAATVEGLATILGRTVAMAADGDPKRIDELLTGCESQAANEAADFAPLIQFAAAQRQAKAGE